MRMRDLAVVLSAVSCFSMQAGVSKGAIADDELQLIREAVPKKAAAKPVKPRKLLVFNRAKGMVHGSIPYAAGAIEIMAETTGAFEVIVSDDMSIFNPKSLEPFDAICFNSSSRMDFSDPAKRKSLMDFVKGGKGVVGIHAATVNFSSAKPVEDMDWPEGAEMLGGVFAGHNWRSGQGQWSVRIDEPAHPLNAAFGGRGFKIADEIYQHTQLRRDSVRVLLSLDFSDPKTAGPREDQRHVPISWVRDWGKGRVFYCSLGHDNHVFWNAAVLKHYLDGIQFALGDLPVETTPRSPQHPVRTRSEQQDIHEDWGSLTWLAGTQYGNADGLVLGRVTLKAGKFNPRHRHPKCEEVLYMLKGRIVHSLGNESYTLSAGDTMTIPAGVFHDARCISDEDADMIVAYSEGIRLFEKESDVSR